MIRGSMGIWVLAAAFVSSQACAAPNPEAVRRACSDDSAHVCRGLDPASPVGAGCLAGHKEYLTPPCAAAVAAVPVARPGLAPDAAGQGAPSIRAVCAEPSIRLCKGMDPLSKSGAECLSAAGLDVPADCAKLARAIPPPPAPKDAALSARRPSLYVPPQDDAGLVRSICSESAARLCKGLDPFSKAGAECLVGRELYVPPACSQLVRKIAPPQPPGPRAAPPPAQASGGFDALAKAVGGQGGSAFQGASSGFQGAIDALGLIGGMGGSAPEGASATPFWAIGASSKGYKEVGEALDAVGRPSCPPTGCKGR